MPNPSEPARPPARGRRLAVAAVGGASALAIAAALGVAWMERGRVASNLAQTYLAERGVSASIRFDEVGPSRLAGSAVLGPANDPDATVERFEVTLGGGGLGAPRVRAVRLIHPTLRLGFDGRRLDFGRLQRLVDELGRGGGGAAPDLRIEGGRVRLRTPGGEARFGLDAVLERGRLMVARARIERGEVGFGGLHARLGGGQASLDRDARGALTGRFDLAAAEMAWGGARIDTARVRGELAAAPSAADRLAGPVQGDAVVEASGARLGEAVRTARARLALSLDGGLLDGGRRFRGAARLQLDASDARGARGEAASTLQLAGDLSDLVLVRQSAGLGVSAHAVVRAAATGVAVPGLQAPAVRGGVEVAALQGRIGKDGALSLAPKVSFAAASLQAPAGTLRGVQGAIDAGRAQFTWGASGWRFAAPLAVRLRADAAADRGGLTGRALQASLAGQGAFGAGGTRLSLTGAAKGELSASAAQARGLAAATPMLSSDPAFEAAVVAAARHVSVSAPRLALALGPGGWSVGLPATVAAASSSGARLALDARAPHALSVTLAGGGLPEATVEVARYDLARDGGLQARGRLRLAWSGQTLDQARLQLGFAAVRRRGVLSVTLPACGEGALGRFGERASPLIAGLSVRTCPSGPAPALVMDGRGWRLSTRLEALGFRAPASEAQVAGGAVELALHVDPRGAPAGAAEVVAARVVDAAAMRRFEPLAISGRLELGDGVWRGPLAVRDARGGRALASVQVRHVMATAAGHAHIAAPRLAFAKGGLQPKDITPIGADLVSDAEGAVAFEGTVDWSPSGLSSGGRFTTTGLAFTSPFGKVQGAGADIQLTSLAPLVSGPAQPVTASSVDWILPLTAARAAVALKADALEVATAEAGVSGGKVRLDPITLPYDQTRGVEGTIRLEELDLAALIDRFDLADKLTIQAKVSGALPFADKGGSLRFTGGRLYATGPGRLSIRPEALTGAAATTAPGAPVPATGDAGVQGFALQALQDLAFDKLDAEVASRPMGRLGVVFHIAGRHDPPKGGEVHVGLIDLLRGRALEGVKDLPKGTEVNLTLDTSLNFDELLAAYAGRGRSEPVQGPAPKP